MKLLIVTQAVDQDHPVLGFFHSWIEELANHCDNIEVITLWEGTHALPINVRVHSLGKEKGRQSVVTYAARFVGLIWNLRHSYDAVFVHMNVEYAMLGGWLWKMLGKRVSLWYTHGTVSLRLRLASVFVDTILTASEASMRLPTAKKRVLGHGIDLRPFPALAAPRGDLTFVTVGRIAEVKRLEVLIEAFALLRTRGTESTLVIVGAPATPEDKIYEETLRERVVALGLSSSVRFTGNKKLEEVREELAGAHLFLHVSATGSLDKAPLQALACGVPVISVNPEIADGTTPAVMFAQPSAESIAEAITDAQTRRIWDDDAVRAAARDYVVQRHGLQNLMRKIVAELSQIPQGKEMEGVAREHFNQAAQEQKGGSYEERRWDSNPRVQAQFDAAKAFIQKRMLPRMHTVTSVLELGPGPGTWTRMLVQAAPNARFTLMDISGEMLARAKAALAPLVPETREGDFVVAPVKPEEADFFFSSRAFEYLSDKPEATRKIANLLTHGGLGCIITKMPKTLANKARSYKPSELHQQQIRPNKLKALLIDAGCTDIRMYLVTTSVPFLHSALADRAVGALLSTFPLNAVSSLFAESYGVLFRKP